MKKFNFSLEPLSRLRSLTVREREINLARAQEELQRAEEARRQKEEELHRAVGKAPRGTLVHVRELLELDAERRRLRDLLVSAERGLVESGREVEENRGRLLDAQREEKVVEKLRERRYLDYLRDLLRQEQKVTDEVAARRHGRRAA